MDDSGSEKRGGRMKDKKGYLAMGKYDTRLKKLEAVMAAEKEGVFVVRQDTAGMWLFEGRACTPDDFTKTHSGVIIVV